MVLPSEGFQCLRNERRSVGVIRVSHPSDEIPLLTAEIHHPSSDGIEVARDWDQSAQPPEFGRNDLGPCQLGFDLGSDGLLADAGGNRKRWAPKWCVATASTPDQGRRP